MPWIPTANGWGPSNCRTRSSSIGESLPVPKKAPTVGEHTEAVLRDVLGYDDAQIKSLRDNEVVNG